MTHLSRDELERWWTGHADSDRARIVGHLAECDACAALYGAIVDAAPPDRAPETSAADVLSLGYDAIGRPSPMPRAAGPTPRPGVRPQPFPRARWGSRRVYVAVVGLAAVLVAAVFVVPALRPAGDAGDGSGIRGSGIQLLAPRGAVAPPVEFRWTSALQAATFRVEVIGANDVALFTLSSPREAITASDEMSRRLEPGVGYRWRVVALDASGAPMTQSTTQSFSLQPKP